MKATTTASILATTAALWFADDRARPGRLGRRLAECSTPPMAEAPLTAADLLAWRNDLDDAQRRQIGGSVFGRRNG